MRQSLVVSLDRAAVIGVAVLAAALGLHSLARHTEHVTRCGLPAAASTAPTAMLIEPPGGPWIWGLTARPNHTVSLDGQAHSLAHGRGQGTLVRFDVPTCTNAVLEIARRTPAPATTSQRSDPKGTVYIPDGTYDLTLVCDGLAHGHTTRLTIAD